MYVVCVLVVTAVSGAFACQPPPCHWSDPTPAINYFKAVANKVIAADRNQLTYCQSGGATLKEEHSPTNYQVKMAVSSGAVEVQVINRVMMILATGCGERGWDVRVLPPYVDAYSGQYCVTEGVLTVSFPYKYDPLRGGGYACEPLRRDTVALRQVQSPDMFTSLARAKSCGPFGCARTQ